MNTLENIIVQVTAGMNSDDEAFKAFNKTLADNITLPTDAFVIGVPFAGKRSDHYAACKRSMGCDTR